VVRRVSEARVESSVVLLFRASGTFLPAARRPDIDTDPTVDVPVQFFQSTVAIELAVAGALLWEIRYFERDSSAPRDRQRPPDARLQLLFALVLAATVFGSLWARR
jgi:hypothetical protein